ncbi:DoxX family protein [Dyadobacter sp.]|uniref:DoxX family protein n=1 Tax=Dyadobacter sp. TaxID=1914288 RepID=UPI003F729360
MPEIVLLFVFIVSLLILRKTRGRYEPALAARIGMAAMLVVTGLAHFGFTKGMEMMLPDFAPFKRELILFTGIIELAAAAGLLLPRFTRLTAWLLIVFFILILPANIYGAMHHINLQTATYDGDGPGYLWFRIPLQLFFIAWIYLSVILPSVLMQRRLEEEEYRK